MALRFGKKPARVDPRTLQLSKYTAALPAPPAGFSSLYRLPATFKDVATVFPMDGNDAVGDCTIAGVAHADTLFNGLVNPTPSVMSAADVEALYFKLTGGPDVGLDCLTVLNYWRKNPINGKQILAYAAVPWKNHTLVQQATSLFGALYIGFQVPDNCMDEFMLGEPWTPGSLLPEGHCVVVTSYSANYLRVLTWGATQLGNWAWWDECVDECYAILPPEAAQPGFNLQGFNLAQLQADLAQV